MNYPWRTAVLDFVEGGDARLFRRRILELLDHYPRPAIRTLMNPLSTHDTPRARTVLGVRRQVDGLEQGNYQPTDEELARGGRGLQLSSLIQYTLPGFPSLYYGDEAGLTGFRDPWNRRCYPWGQEDQELLGFFKRLGQIRRKNAKAMREEIQFLSAAEGVAAYRRGSIVTAVCAADSVRTIELPGRAELLLPVGEAELKGAALRLSPGSGAILRLMEG